MISLPQTMTRPLYPRHNSRCERQSPAALQLPSVFGNTTKFEVIKRETCAEPSQFQTNKNTNGSRSGAEIIRDSLSMHMPASSRLCGHGPRVCQARRTSTLRARPVMHVAIPLKTIRSGCSVRYCVRVWFPAGKFWNLIIVAAVQLTMTLVGRNVKMLRHIE